MLNIKREVPKGCFQSVEICVSYGAYYVSFSAASLDIIFISISNFILLSSTSSIVFGSNRPFVSGSTHAANDAISARLPMKTNGNSLAVYFPYSEDIFQNELASTRFLTRKVSVRTIRLKLGKH